MQPSEHDIITQVETAVVPVLSAHGYELVLTEYVPRSRILRLFIDRQGGVSIDDCTRVSHLVSDVLDGEGLSDRISGSYNLEVSSPGLDRPLVKPADFQKYVGKKVNVQTRLPVDGRRKFGGELVFADADGVRIQIDGRPYALTYGQIERARLVPEL